MPLLSEPFGINAMHLPTQVHITAFGESDNTLGKPAIVMHLSKSHLSKSSFCNVWYDHKINFTRAIVKPMVLLAGCIPKDCATCPLREATMTVLPGGKVNTSASQVLELRTLCVFP